jgi:HEAT repeat protein
MSGNLPSHLAKGLESNNSTDLLDAIRECMRLETAAATERLTALLRGNQPADLRSQAARALGVCAGEDANEAFLGIASGDAAPWLRITCIDILGWIGAPATAPALLALLDTCPAEIAVVILDAIRDTGRLGDADADLLERQLGAPEPEVRVAAALAMSTQADVTRHESALSFAADDSEPLVRVAASLGLARSRGERGTPAWQEAWLDAPPRARQQVLRVVRDAGCNDFRQLLEPLLDLEAEPTLWRELAMALSELASPVIAAAIAEKLKQGSRDPVLALALAELGNSMGEHLLQLEANSAASNRHHLVGRALCLLGHPDITKQYGDMLQSDAGSERRAAALNLAATGSRQATSVLLDTLDFAYLRERRQALRLIMNLYDLSPDSRPDIHAPREDRRHQITRLRRTLTGENSHDQESTTE